MKKLLFVINPKAGLKKKKDYIDEIVSVFEDAGYQVGTKYTKQRADGTEIVAKYGNRVDLIVCMGGDGTLNEVIEGMIESNVTTPLGYIPSGSTNDFANSLGLRGNPLEQAKNIMTKEAGLLDIGCFNGRHFVYTASAGAFVKASYSTPQRLKNKIGHAAYVISGVKDFFRLKPMKLKIELEDETLEGEYVFVAVNNATQVGGIMKINEDLVEFNDGMFEMMLIDFPENPFQIVKIINKMFFQDFTGEIKLKQITKARITDCSEIDWSLDGEEQKGQEVIDISVIPNAIKFIY